jgi:hypothetical protein
VVHPAEEVKDGRPRVGVNLIALESRAQKDVGDLLLIGLDLAEPFIDTVQDLTRQAVNS